MTQGSRSQSDTRGDTPIETTSLLNEEAGSGCVGNTRGRGSATTGFLTPTSRISYASINGIDSRDVCSKTNSDAIAAAPLPQAIGKDDDDASPPPLVDLSRVTDSVDASWGFQARIRDLPRRLSVLPGGRFHDPLSLYTPASSNRNSSAYVADSPYNTNSHYYYYDTLPKASSPFKDHHAYNSFGGSSRPYFNPNPSVETLRYFYSGDLQSCQPASPVEGEGNDGDNDWSADALASFNPHWDDMITFRQTEIGAQRDPTSWSANEESVYSQDLNASPTLGWRLLPWVESPWRRPLLLVVAPALFVVAWCAVPIPTVVRDHSPPLGKAGRGTYMNFWFFLFFYYGIYSAVALLLVTQIFRLYSLNWWPRSMSGVTANAISWMIAMGLGSIAYLSNWGWAHEPFTWTGITLSTLLFPIVISFMRIQGHHQRSSRRQSINEYQQIFSTAVEWRVPASYRRFLWFCSTFLLWYVGLTVGEYLAYAYTSTPHHSSFAGLQYVYSWIAIVYVLDSITAWIIALKVQSWPLLYIFQLYFSVTYFIFYRNLFARLRTPSQVLLVQFGSSLGLVIVFPFRMARWVHSVLARLFSLDSTYDEYFRMLSRTFFLRNVAENVTMLGFLCWATILHFGPNKVIYPYFEFNRKDEDEESRSSYEMTIIASGL
ncbi:hypothetical protein EV182_003142, partial [Spiromyces aspiralis]